jgi:Domain of unknown function (DUF4190)
MSMPEKGLVGTPQEIATRISPPVFGNGRFRVSQIAAILGLALSPGVFSVDVFTARQFGIGDTLGVAPLVVGIVGIALIVFGYVRTPAVAVNRRRAFVWLTAALIIAILYDLINNDVRQYGIAIPYLVLVSLPPLAYAAGVCGWLTLRGRPSRSYAMIAILLLLIPFAFVVQSIPWTAVLLVSRWILYAGLPLIAVILAGLISSGETAAGKSRSLEDARAQSGIEAQARAIQNWQAAYALANPGQPIPAPPLALGDSTYSAANRTNTMAILALVLGFFVSIFGIIFGHVALSQIRRTGEGGRALAIAGLVLGYVGVGLAVVLIIFDSVVFAPIFER